MPSSSQTHEPNVPSDLPLKETPEKGIEEPKEEEEEGECGFCLFMKAGGCRGPFIEWEKCVDEGEKNKEDIVQKCHDVTKALKDCMEAHPDHYGPVLEAQDQAINDLENENGKEGIVESILESNQGSGFIQVEKVVNLH